MTAKPAYDRLGMAKPQLVPSVTRTSSSQGSRYPGREIAHVRVRTVARATADRDEAAVPELIDIVLDPPDRGAPRRTSSAAPPPS